jgi:hypothetical protein
MAYTSTRSTNKNVNLSNYEKGLRFEKYVINLFNQQFFDLVSHNESKKQSRKENLPGNHSAISPDPDITLMLFGRRKYKFAIECKWRSRFYNGKITWAEDYQIRNYKEYGKYNGIRVFVAIGIGGEPSDPNELFVTPLHYIEHSSEAHRDDLLKYVRKPRRRFGFDPVQLSLYQTY